MSSQQAAMRRRERCCGPPPTRLGRYLDRDGRPREVQAIAGAGGSVLVVDRDALTLCDRRLVAHLGPEEPYDNALLMADLYLRDPHGRWCRPLVPEDLSAMPTAGPREPAPAPALASALSLDGCLYRLGAHRGADGTRQLRWLCAISAQGPWRPLSLREAVERVESYEPLRTLTAQALGRNHGGVSLSLLRGELRRLNSSAVVLNRGLREAVVEAVERRGLSLSEIALRCGRVKRDRKGRCSGETSWVARRVGLMPEGGEARATRWIHSQVLATIARRGLELSPREVELG